MKSFRATLVSFVALASLLPGHVNAQLSYKRDGVDTTSTPSADSYGGGQDHTGTLTLSDGGKTATFAGNAWKAFKIDPYEIKFDTRFTFSAELIEASEINAICLDADRTYCNQRPRCLAFGGTQSMTNDINFKLLEYNTVGGGSKYYEVPIGQYFTGTMNYIALVQDKDDNRLAGKSIVKEIRIFSGTSFIIDQC